MDLAWLWPIRETMRKSARTCATVLENMERYDEYKFGMSQPQQLAWIKEQHPEMFKRIQRRVAEGRWECQGCMWVEPDTNLTGGESLIRQTMHGQRFWEENFETNVNFLWEPDVFGYSAAVSATTISRLFPKTATKKCLTHRRMLRTAATDFTEKWHILYDDAKAVLE